MRLFWPLGKHNNSCLRGEFGRTAECESQFASSRGAQLARGTFGKSTESGFCLKSTLFDPTARTSGSLMRRLKSELGESQVSFSARKDFMMLPGGNRCFNY